MELQKAKKVRGAARLQAPGTAAERPRACAPALFFACAGVYETLAEWHAAPKESPLRPLTMILRCI
jgi:hypothetical protein